jgi:hypothetical protein
MPTRSNKLGDTLNADFGGHSRSGPSGDHDRAEHGAELPDQGQGHRCPQKTDRSELVHDVVKLKPQDHACKKAHEHDNACGARADKVDLVDDFDELLRMEDQRKRPGEEDGHGAEVVVQADGKAAERVEKGRHDGPLFFGRRRGSGDFRQCVVCHHASSMGSSSKRICG